ncbi:RrF2 family transcriptional regulator [Yanghanlia caeni]|uniref:Rrf2 family transcriptional regulator n=1 Tax=Yanghanlia caeni TaxID=3064283 RepID=A0ABU1D2I5_9BURK|nr:Rrf2 family transcriptional regulator [Alcaligenaceae bacterium LG-2]
MRLTAMTDYSMRLLMHLAAHPDRLCTIAEVARVHGISEPHLMKITHRLAQAGWVETTRGKNGGMRLARAPADIPVGAVVRDMENDLAVVECLGTGPTRCILTGQCGLTRVMQGALDKFMTHLDAFTLADIMPARDDQTKSQRMVTGCERSSEITVSPTSPSISEMT